MTDYAVGIDRGTNQDSKTLNDICTYLQQCSGGNVTALGIGPSKVQNYGLSSASKGKTAIYIANGVGLDTPQDFAVGIGKYYHYDKCIFVWPGWIGNQYMTEEAIKTHKVPREHDFTSVQFGVAGQTALEYFSQANNVELVYGNDAQTVAQKICNGNYVGTSGGASSSSDQSQSNVSPLLTGDMTFEELVGEICNGIDLLFLVKRSTIVVTDFESIYAEAKYLRDKYPDSVKGENINLWQIEQDSFEMEVNQIGFYNTVYVHYKDGIVRESYDDLVRVYGEVPITYHDSSVDKTTAIMKAKAYLAAHLRDFEMTVNASILTEPDIEIGDIVTIKNPKTLQNDIRTAEGRDPEFLFVNGVSTNWEGDSAIMTDIECKFAPTSPNKLDVPTSGNGDGNSQSSGASGSFNSCGVSSDGTQVKAIGKASAPGETSTYGSGFYESVFENMCPFCQKPTLAWDIFWAGNETSNWGFSSCRGASEGSSAEGAVFCKSCDADFSVFGHNHVSGSSVSLNRISGPTPSSKEAIYKLKGGG